MEPDSQEQKAVQLALGKCPKCDGPITYKTVEGPKLSFDGRGMYIGQIAEGLWCERCEEWQPWGSR